MNGRSRADVVARGAGRLLTFRPDLDRSRSGHGGRLAVTWRGHHPGRAAASRQFRSAGLIGPASHDFVGVVHPSRYRLGASTCLAPTHPAATAHGRYTPEVSP